MSIRGLSDLTWKDAANGFKHLMYAFHVESGTTALASHILSHVRRPPFYLLAQASLACYLFSKDSSEDNSLETYEANSNRSLYVLDAKAYMGLTYHA
jgi:hypothetical protein